MGARWLIDGPLCPPGADPEGTAGARVGVRKGFESPKAPRRRRRREGREWGGGFSPQSTVGHGERRKVLQRVPRRSPGQKRISVLFTECLSLRVCRELTSCQTMENHSI